MIDRYTSGNVFIFIASFSEKGKFILQSILIYASYNYTAIFYLDIEVEPQFPIFQVFFVLLIVNLVTNLFALNRTSLKNLNPR